MTAELASIPKVARNYAGTLVNRALRKIYDENNWSFNLGESNWLTPPVISAGTITTTIGSPTIVGDATAAADWIAGSNAGSLLTQRQIRTPAYSLYNIIAFDGVDTLTVDRPWLEPAHGAGVTYLLYGAYYPAPVDDFVRWLNVRDFTNAANLNFWQFKQTDLAASDPQRTIFMNPSRVVPFESDHRTGSSTFGRMLFELYPHQLAQLPYYLYYVRKGLPLVSASDTVPYPLTEELVIWRAKVMAYEWKESQKGEDAVRGSGSNWQFLMQAADAEYKDRLKDIRKTDRDLVDNFVTRLRRVMPATGAPFYSPITGQGSIGGW